MGLRKPNESWKPVQFSGARPPNASIKFGGTFKRRGDISRLIRSGGIGVELGVAKGQFSKTLLQSSELAFLYSIDMWAGDRGHDIDQYREAIRLLDPYRSRNSTIKLRFDEALPLFPDEYFDFIYIDGYAHTGEENGQTLEDWWPKLKRGGLFAGDDYSPIWPLVTQAVNAFANRYQLELHLIEPQTAENGYSESPTWLAFKAGVV